MKGSTTHARNRVASSAKSKGDGSDTIHKPVAAGVYKGAKDAGEGGEQAPRAQDKLSDNVIHTVPNGKSRIEGPLRGRTTRIVSVSGQGDAERREQLNAARRERRARAKVPPAPQHRTVLTITDKHILEGAKALAILIGFVFAWWVSPVCFVVAAVMFFGGYLYRG